MGRILEVQKPDLTKEKVCYDRGVTVRIDANGHRKRETRDVQGRLIKVEEYEGIYSSCTTDVGTPYATTTYQYDRVGNLLAVTDTNSNATTMTYDTLGRKFSMYDPDMGAWNYGYDDNGNLIWQRDAKGQTISFQYDSLNRLLRKDYPTGTDVTLAYDEAYHGYSGGRLTTMTDASGSTRYDYDDSLARTTRMTKNIDGVNYTITTRVDGLGRAASITYPDGETVTNSYDSGGNLRKVGNYLTLSGFTAIGQPGQEAFGNGVSTYYGYNTQTKRLSTLQVYNGSQFIQLLNHTYDLRGNVTSISASNWNSTTGSWDSARSQTFQYDALDRLKQAQSTAYGTLGYAYDKIGNLAAKEGVTFTPAPARPHAVGVSSDGQSYTYDANGNMLSDGTRTITWDYDNRPASITVGGATTSFVYDGMGNRVKKIGPAGAIVYIDKLYEVSGGVGAKYIYANGKRIALKTPTQTYYYHGNHLGSTSLVTDAARNVVEEIFYKPFGDSFTDSGSISLNHKYTGQELDAETGLYFYNARYYNPAIGRFISADTIVPDPADPQAFNRYSYVLNNPLKYIDPTGHDFVITGGGGGGGSDWGYTGGGPSSSSDDWITANNDRKRPPAPAPAPAPAPVPAPAPQPLPPMSFGNHSSIESRVLPGGYFDVGGFIYSPWGVVVDGGDMGALFQVDDLFSLKATVKGPLLLLGIGKAGLKSGRLLWSTWASYPKVLVAGREYAQIGGRLYTRHAVERMMPRGLTTLGRSLSPNMVEDIIRYSKPTEVVVDGVTRQIYRSGSTEIVTEQGGKLIVTVNPFKY